MTEPLREIRAVAFDAYGTLFDVGAAVAEHRAAVGDGLDRVWETWRRKQLEYTWLRSAMGRWADFERITADALDVALMAEGIRDATLRETLPKVFRNVGAFADVVETLRTLRSAGVPTAIVSNGTSSMLAEAVASAGLESLVDPVISVEPSRVYKPDPAAYGLAVQRLDVPATSIAFVSANAWDVVGARTFGFPAIWVDRSDSAWSERLGAAPTARVRALTETLPLIVR